MSSAMNRQETWQAFLQRWPIESLGALTLEEYSQPDDKACLSGWVKYRTDGLGWRPGGGSGLDRVGVCSFSSSVKERAREVATYRARAASRVDESRGYCWKAALGDSLDGAFELVKQRVLDIALAARQGNPSILCKPLLHEDFEWKLFFLYQDPKTPVLLAADWVGDLSRWYWHKFKKSIAANRRVDAEKAVLANSELMAARRGRPLFEYVDELVAMSELDVNGESFDDEARDASNGDGAQVVMNEPLNQILYGPPGTGKTYATIERALRILDPALLASLEADADTLQRRVVMKARFDELKTAGRVRFVTFHQSFSYEDFVEGIRAQSGPDGLHYNVEPGVFKQLCEDAADMPDVDKVIQQFLDDAADKPQALTTPTGKPFTVTYQEGNETVSCLPASSATNKALPANIDAVKQVLREQPPQKKIYCESYVLGIVNHLKPKLPDNGATAHERQPHVLIIDEINRGNVSRIFGELITLIEPSKRAGQAEALSTTLPYSREPFSVPDNVFLIGTMNTADRSLASLDVALRRRFVFEELPPEPALLNGVKVAGRVPVDALLSVMNQRIEALLDRDHLIGHASFMSLVAEPTLPKLAEVFRRQVLPLLQEYFFEDWQRIQWVLNDHRKPKALQFVRQSPVKVADLFGANVQVSARPLWEINDDAFDNIEAYASVITSQAPTPDEPGIRAEGEQ